ncbi:MAG: carbohydrate ABC transporter permease [Bacillota bacterium]|nr:carbohydrate ABC transporter permease [Bacillota bacterium]
MKRFLKNNFSLSDLFILPICVVFLYPFYFLVISTFKTLREVSYNPTAFPTSLYLGNYIEVFEKTPIFMAFRNTFFLTICSVLLIVVIGEMAAYPIVFNSNKFNNAMLVYLMLGFLVPFQAILLSLFEVMQVMNLLDSLPGMVVFYANGSALTVFLAVGYMRSIPKELNEAAIVDGASPARIFFQIIFPLMKAITITSIIFNTMWIWNDFIAPNIFLNSRSNTTLVLEIFRAKGQFTTNWPIFMTLSTVTIFPIFVFYCFMQKYIIKGLTAGAVKG